MNRAQRRAGGQRRGEYEPETPFARLMRPKCSVCEAPVRWMSPGDALVLLGPDRLNGALEMVKGEDDSLEPVDVWQCTSCDEFGVLYGGGSGGGWS